MNDHRRRKLLLAQKVDRYDGQSIFINGELRYELGGYLGGGTAGVVYEAFCPSTKQHVALKILNPIGYKLMPTSLLARCLVAIKGRQMEPDVVNGLQPMRNEHVWWLVHQSSKQAIAAYEDPRSGAVKELTLPRCIEVWGTTFDDDIGDDDKGAVRDIAVKGQLYKIPFVPKKFVKFARNRCSIYREISNMSELDAHVNVLRLDDALELQQDSKCTIFLVLELAAGGELFDRIKLDCGTDEATARAYFKQLVSGVAFCHQSGVCHRDLKPENLLLADNEELSTLKIADFGLSAIFSITEHTNGDSTTAIRRLRSVVGSPHYVAPEVLQDASGQGYDGAKADAWSIGVILYAMLAGKLPFGKDLLKCVRYDRFKKWSQATKYNDDDDDLHDDGDSEDPAQEHRDAVVFPDWFFPVQFSYDVKALLAQLLYPDPCLRLSVDEAMKHRWVLDRPRRLLRQTHDVLQDTAVGLQGSAVDAHDTATALQTTSDVGSVLKNPHQDNEDTVRWPHQVQQHHHGHIVRNMHNLHVSLTSPPPPPSSLIRKTTSPLFQKVVSPQSLTNCNSSTHRGHGMGLHRPGYMPSVDETGPLHTPKHQKDRKDQAAECETCKRTNCSCDDDVATTVFKSDPFLSPPLAPLDDPVTSGNLAPPTPFSLSTW
ncbi:CAMK/CAMKL/MARK protein kinase [Aphanomyces invadans]|uniref:non-specific serine/threonine protein kinase n=1 Tax=Aphanomyces invadans TaxID=157072 RepID=A0A024TV81_9STRA|nr:CAMK/CAMKL/MARK protein kinase [Aphanomyces invadans]ETV97898.1 CAMK/CAMKL/MARK protein kinase [Aphanomyces invadans]|eukprot:XP_008873459.1 CAMK/CAMKL/MARK protein kinase [Aphanomyces invadans]